MITHKRRKSSRMHGRKMGSHGRGARKKGKGSGHRGGFGMAGTGKRADQKKTLVLKLYGHEYFGKQGVTSKKTKRDKRDRINLYQIQSNPKIFGKKVGDKWEINLENHKILAEGEVREKMIIRAKEASESAIQKIRKIGGDIILVHPKKDDKIKK
ncbi:MAG TPA: uL15 family ribosomal protein [Candidatus Nanoarchaeia archaeon]|nr:uL15 family ribosomal protein [Candidatus Nanoarchaeia archaeon]